MALWRLPFAALHPRWAAPQRPFLRVMFSVPLSRQKQVPLATARFSSTDAGTQVPLEDTQKATAATAATAAPAEEAEIPPEVSELFETLRGEALRRLDDFQPIHLFSLCWAYSTARLLDDDLQRNITKAALRLGRAKDATQAKVDQEDEQSIDEDTGEGETPRVVKATEHWMAILKPAHWQVSVDAKEASRMANASPFEEDEDNEEEPEKPKVQAWIHKHMSQKYPICTDATEAFGLLHRLDAQTSGVLVCAKSYEGAYWLRLQWCQYAVDKEYVCVVHGWVDRSEREIHKRIRVEKRKAPNSRRTVSTFCTVGPNGKPSFTELYTLSHLKHPETQEPYSLVVLKLHTGRTHQIRVHMLSIGHPLVTDSKYAEERLTSDRSWCPRNFLHTYRLAFRDVPSDQELEDHGFGEVQELVTPLPNDLTQTLQNLEPVDEISRKHWEDWCAGEASHLQAFEKYLEADAAQNV